MACLYLGKYKMSDSQAQRQTLFEEGIPHIISPDVYDYVFDRGKNFVQQDGDKVLVHRKTIEFKDKNYTVDYIISYLLDEKSEKKWLYSKIIYLENSPFPCTIKKNEEISIYQSSSPSLPCSSSSFRSAAYAMIASIENNKK
jgi:hypothetical protein